MPTLPRASLRSTVLALLIAVALAACSSPTGDEPPADFVAVGTEAWTGASPSPAAAADAGTTNESDGAGTDQTGLAAAEPVDPTAQMDVAAGGTAGAPPPVDQGAAPAIRDDVAATLAAMSVEQKVGQLFTVTVIGNDADNPSEAARRSNTQLYGVATPAEVVRAYHLGGVAYLDHNMGPGTSNVADVPQVSVLSAGLQRAAAADTGIGLLIAADQEGGPVVRLRAPATVFPAARQIGNTGNAPLAQEVGQVTAREALAVGINWVYAPVADVNVNPNNPVIGDRAFGTEPGRVGEFVRATTQGIVAAGALPTLKHYPGHGDTDIDSHNSLPTINHDLATLRSVDLPPFALAASDPLRVSVMVGHLAVPALDPTGTPATLSRPIIDVLRGELGFAGLVVTDAMNMGALSGFGDPGSLSIQAIAAGIDVVLLPTDLPAAYSAVVAAVNDGTLPLATVDAAVTRILATKQALGLLRADLIPPGDASQLGTSASQDVRARLRSLCSC